MSELNEIMLNDLTNELILRLREKKLTFGTAESCTGGLISKTVTDIAGCSDVFLGGIVSYANSVKEGLLGVDEKTLWAIGAVSPEVAMRMALGAKEALGADVTVAVTGIAGPGGGSHETPVGLVYIAVCHGDDKLVCEECRFDGTREEIRNAAAYRALSMALDAIS